MKEVVGKLPVWGTQISYKAYAAWISLPNKTEVWGRFHGLTDIVSEAGSKACRWGAGRGHCTRWSEQIPLCSAISLREAVLKERITGFCMEMKFVWWSIYYKATRNIFSKNEIGLNYVRQDIFFLQNILNMKNENCGSYCIEYKAWNFWFGHVV